MKKFNKDRYLKKLQIRRWLQSNSRSLYIGVSCLFVCIIGIYFAYSKFFVKQEVEVVKTTVGEFKNGDIVLNIYVDNEKVDAAPKKSAGYEFDQISCDNDAKGTWNSDTWNLLVNNLTKKTKCNIYFKKIVTKVPDIIATVDTTGKCPTVNDDGSVSVTGVEATDGYLCKATDAYGDSYYYRGNVANNYVLFADKYWRIVRINGDGTVRVIYDGTSAHANGESSKDRQITLSTFASNNNDNAYVGYMYGSIGASTYVEAHANTNDSTIKAYIDNWYKANILGTANEEYLADNVFCNDRSFSKNNTGTGTGTSVTEYRWSIGPWDGSGSVNTNMLLICPQQNDAFTVSNTSIGNGDLTYPIGLLSMDEITLAGGWFANNSGYYLYTGQNWWSSSPAEIYKSVASEAYVSSNGKANGIGGLSASLGVRPVINLKTEVLKYGDGTLNNPYHL